MEQERALLVDLGDAAEIARTRRLKGAVALSHGLPEFRADRESRTHDRAFDPGRPVVLYCGSGARSRPARR